MDLLYGKDDLDMFKQLYDDSVIIINAHLLTSVTLVVIS